MNGSNLKTTVTENDHHIGVLNVPVTLVLYGDYECPYTKESADIVNQLLRKYRDHICFVFRHFPRTKIHPHSGLAAEAAEAAERQGQFWKLHDAFCETHRTLTTEYILNMARHFHLDMNTFLNDLKGNNFSEAITQTIRDGLQSGVRITPTFFINGHRYDGFQPLEKLQSIIERNLEDNKLSFLGGE
jgi:protein-disulfide isomerase